MSGARPRVGYSLLVLDEACDDCVEQEEEKEEID